MPALRILLIDDDPLMARIVHALLRRDGFQPEVVRAEDTEQAAEHLHRGGFDCILLDYLLPGVNGREFLQVLRQVDRHTPVVALTGAGSEEVAVAMMKAGASDYIPKAGLTHDRLSQAIADAVARARQRGRDARNLDVRDR
ncbi:MAG: response regulator [Halobacteriales archaeon]|nr:response regulator [Halobacteriales archaeon]